jgi:hypothetical protein
MIARGVKIRGPTLKYVEMPVISGEWWRVAIHHLLLPPTRDFMMGGEGN